MATIKLNHIFFLTFLMAFSVTNALTKKEITDVCNQVTDPPSCVALLEKDPKVGTAQMSDVLVIVMPNLKKEATDATTHLNIVRPQFKDPNGKTQISICVKNFGSAATTFQSATDLAAKKSFEQMSRLMESGYKAVAECKLTVATPGQSNPIEQNVMKIGSLSSIADVLMEKLIGS